MRRNGAERSGLFCVALYVVQQIKTQQKVDIFSAVKHIRLYRPQCIANMVRFLLFSIHVQCAWQFLANSETKLSFFNYFRNSISSSMNLHRNSSSEDINKPRLTRFHNCVITDIKTFNIAKYFNIVGRFISYHNQINTNRSMHMTNETMLHCFRSMKIYSSNL